MTEYIPKEELDDLTSSSSSSSSSLFLMLCNTIAPFTSIGMFLSPIPTIRNIVKTGTVGDLPLLPYTSMITSCFVWIIYGLIQHQPIVYFTNLIEFILSIYYFIEFTNYAPQYSITFPGSVYNHIHFTIFIWCITIVIAIFFFNKTSKIILLGDLTVLLTILTLASPLTAINAVLHNENSSSIPWPFTIAAILNCFIWTIVGIFELHDSYVYFPEILGLLFGTLQIFLKIKYPEKQQTGGGASSSSSSSSPSAYVEMPFPFLENIRQIIMYGNNNNASGGASSSAAYSALNLHENELALDYTAPNSVTTHVNHNSTESIEFIHNGGNNNGGFSSNYDYHHQQQQLPQQQQVVSNTLFNNEPQQQLLHVENENSIMCFGWNVGRLYAKIRAGVIA